MGLKATQKQLALAVVVIALAKVGADAAAQALPGCVETCGNVSIPYPFGIGVSNSSGKNCFLQEDLELVCSKSALYRRGGTLQILNISLQGKKDTLPLISEVCKDEYGSRRREGNLSMLHIITPAFSLSNEDNRFISVGCDTYGYLNNFHNGMNYSTGCLTRCNSIADMRTMQTDGNCTGVGCCQVDIPPAMKNISIQAYSFNNFNYSWGFNNCSYSFIAKKGSYNFSVNHLMKRLPSEIKRVPMVLEWTVGNDTCVVSKSRRNYACRSNSNCENSSTGYGYRCRCDKGFEGNPYLPDGCRDIEECKNNTHNCISEQHCRETKGSFECFCPVGESGDGKREGRGCQQDSVHTKVAIGVGVGLVILIVGTSWLYLIYQKRKLIKLKEKFFRQNGGIILQQKLSAREDSSQSAQIFMAKQLSKATNNYDESLIIGKGSYGTVYKGFLSDNRIVAVKKSKVVDQSQIEQFINEVVVLSQINHRNVVKLLGCCLDTEVPLLVYEFVNNGTLFDYLHNEGKTNASWKTRLRIAVEVAEALSYLHSSASIPIIHRDVKSANILLDDTYTAKVSDFGASRLIPIDQIELATMVQGTLGYLDPEYMQTSQLNEKSDVYSFGVMLVELLTGEQAFSFARPEEKRNLAKHFISCLKIDHLFDVLEIGILNKENEEEIKEVALLAAKCLRLKREERPSMKEVAMELEGLMLMEKHPWTNTEVTSEKTQRLLHEASSIFEHGNGSTSSYQNTRYNNLRNNVLIAFDNGR